jgi:hypothetical protein
MNANTNVLTMSDMYRNEMHAEQQMRIIVWVIIGLIILVWIYKRKSRG